MQEKSLLTACNHGHVFMSMKSCRFGSWGFPDKDDRVIRFIWDAAGHCRTARYDPDLASRNSRPAAGGSTSSSPKDPARAWGFVWRARGLDEKRFRSAGPGQIDACQQTSHPFVFGPWCKYLGSLVVGRTDPRRRRHDGQRPRTLRAASARLPG